MIDGSSVPPRDYQGTGHTRRARPPATMQSPAIVNGGFVGTTSGVARRRGSRLLSCGPHPTGARPEHGGDRPAGRPRGRRRCDVLNYSVTGSTQSIVTPEEVAFGAADAGVVVVTAAGNTGDEVGGAASCTPP